MQGTVQLRVLDANTFLRDSLIGAYQFDLLGIYVEKVQYATYGHCDSCKHIPIKYLG